MTITATPNQALTEQALTLCRTYADEYGNDTDHHEFLRLIADIWQTTGTRIPGARVEEILLLDWEASQIEAGNLLPGGWRVSHPEHGPAVSERMDAIRSEQDTIMAAALWRKEW